MKSTSFIPPVIALIVAGVWTGTRYLSLSAMEARNTRLRDEIAAAQSTKTLTPVKLTKEVGPIDWEKLATEEENGPEMQRFKKLMKSMIGKELIDALDRIAMLECSKNRRNELEREVILLLGQSDPEWVLNRFQDRLRDNELPLDRVFGNWTGKDLSRATAWFDAQIAAGNLNSKSLDKNRGSQPRQLFEATVIDGLLASDSAAAARRLGALPEKQRESVISLLTNGMTNRVLNEPLTKGNHLAFANLVRSQLPADRQIPFLAACVPYFWDTEDFPKFNAYMDAIEATPAERITCAEIFSGTHIRMLSNKRKVTLDDLETLRGHFAGISSDDVDVMTARTLAEALKGRNGSMMFPQASGLALELLEASGSDTVLATFLEIAAFDKQDKTLGRELTGKISDEARRVEILKRFD